MIFHYSRLATEEFVASCSTYEFKQHTFPFTFAHVPFKQNVQCDNLHYEQRVPSNRAPFHTVLLLAKGSIHPS